MFLNGTGPSAIDAVASAAEAVTDATVAEGVTVGQGPTRLALRRAEDTKVAGTPVFNGVSVVQGIGKVRLFPKGLDGER